MKILITGTRGYIANALKKYFDERADTSESVFLLDLRGTEWKEIEISSYDILIHCAALVHKNEKKYRLKDYMCVNTELTKQIALKAKKEGVSFFCFFSTVAVYGTTGSFYERVVLTKDTPPHPITKYGISKYAAEKELQELEDEKFKVAIIRPPFVYGRDCPGNYMRLREIVLRYGFIPQINNCKSMIYIENLCEFMYQICIKKKDGVFCPQDLPYRCTADLCRYIAKYNGKKTCETNLFNPLIKFMSMWVRSIRVAFGNLYYQAKDSKMEFEYSLIDFDESVKRTEKGL